MTSKVFVTGASGYIAKHIILQLLLAGHNVVGSVRNMTRADEVRAAVMPHLPEDIDLEFALDFKVLDLTSDHGWQDALSGCTSLIHTASPFPLTSPRNEDDLIRPAVDGTVRALSAADAAGIKRVVLTSSAVAVMQANPPQNRTFDETDWSDPDHPTNSAYGRSKLQAERAAWAYATDHKLALTTINPVLVFGAPLDTAFGSSVSIIQRLLRGKDPMLPKIGFPIVDVKDVAKMHVAALTNDETHGMRILANSGFLWFNQVAETLQKAYPSRKITTRVAPNFLIKLMARFDQELRVVVPFLDVMQSVSNLRARRILGIEFTTPRDSIRQTAAFLIENDAL